MPAIQFLHFRLLSIWLLVINLLSVDYCLGQAFFDHDLFSPSEEEPLKAACTACNNVIRSFNKGYDETARNAYDGGDTSWEKKSKNRYADSELRLTEIQEKICDDVFTGKYQCIEMSQKHEEKIENWWFEHRPKGFDLFRYLCVDDLKVCCPEGHFGSDCQPCKGHPEAVCSGNGECDGSGTRLGTGNCKCNSGYQGDLCNECTSSHLLVSDKCEACDTGCEDGCTELGPKGCKSCRHGYYEHPELGCKDIDECLPMDQNPCTDATFCMNTQGSYECMPCDVSCQICKGNGSDKCSECAKGFEMNDGKCVEIRQSRRKPGRETLKYLIYVLITMICSMLMKWKPLVSLLIVIFLSIFIALNEYAIDRSLNSLYDVYEELFD